MRQFPIANKKRRGAVSAWIMVLGVAVLCALAFWGVWWSTKAPDIKKNPEKPAVLSVGVSLIAMESWNQSVQLTGTIRAEDRLKIGSELSGLKIVEVAVEEGDRVVAGQILARLNTDILRTRLDQLEARYAQQQAAIQKAVQPNRPLEIAQLESALRQSQAAVEQEKANLRLAEASLENARLNANRYDNLYDKGAVASTETENRSLELERQKSTVQGAKDRIQGAEFAVRQAEERLRLAQQGGRAEDVEIARAQARELSAQMDEVRTQISQANIVAPAAGWVLSRDAHLGDIVGSGTVLFELAKSGRLEFAGDIAATQLSSVKVGQLVLVNHAEIEVKGSVVRVSPLVDPQTRNAELVVSLPMDSGLRPGMFCSAVLEVQAHQAVTVPLEAVRGEAPDYYVFVVSEGDIIKKTPIVIGERQQGKAVVKSGLGIGSKVVTKGGAFLRDGDKVTVS